MESKDRPLDMPTPIFWLIWLGEEGVSEMSKKAAAKLGRRDFFRKAGLGAGAAGVAAVGLSTSEGSAAVPGRDAVTGEGYRETEHVKKFYELARF